MSEQFVKWSIFIWVVGIATSIIGALFAIQITMMDNVSTLRSDIAAIKTDVGWIKNTMQIKSVTILK
jgi:hypothetical protein